MSHIETDQTDDPQETLKVFSLNTGLSGRQVFIDPDPSIVSSVRFNKILDFIRQESPDVVLLQEVYENDLVWYGDALGGQMAFSRFCNLSLNNRGDWVESFGIAIGSRHSLFDVKEHYYDSEAISPDKIVLNNGADHAHSLLQASLKKGSDRFNFGTLHNTWNSQAEPSQLQLSDFANLDDVLNGVSDIVLTGDLNSPRSYPLYDSLAQSFRDWMPQDLESTHDFTIRPGVTWRSVIDLFLTSEHYQVPNLRLVEGLSDHLGILAEVRRVNP